MRIRIAHREEAAAIAAIQERGWQAAYRHVYPPELLDEGGFADAGRWRERIERPPSGWATLVAEEDSAVVGFACIGPSRDAVQLGELYALYVEPERWHEGVGRALLAAGEERLQPVWAEAALWVLEENARARRFYERAGWSPDGARKQEERFGVRAAEVRYRKRLG